MSQLTLVQKRALLAAAYNYRKKKDAYKRATRELSDSYWAPYNAIRTQIASNQMQATISNLVNATAVLDKLVHKIGVNEENIKKLRKLRKIKDNYRLMSKNVISSVIKKHKFAGPLIARAQDKTWLRGHEAEMERARANFRNFEKGVFHQKINLIGESHRKKTPSPPKRASPRRTSPPPANNAHRRVHGIGPANNTRITWSRNANGKISIHKTLTNLNLGLTNAQRMVLESMPQNQAINAIRQMARER
jgi:hypothetical protein